MVRWLGELRDRVGPTSDGLVRRVRWLFLLFFAVAVGASVIGVLETTEITPQARNAATVALLGWFGWAVHRFRRPDASLLTDAVPVAAMIGLGLATGGLDFVFAPAFVSLYFRAMFGSRTEVLLNGLAYYVAYEAVGVLAYGAAEMGGVGAFVMFVSFLSIAVVMQALGAAAREQQQLVERERILTDVSRQLLRARSVERVRRVAVDGAHGLVGGGQASVSLWEGEETLRLVASAGPGLVDIDTVSLAGAAPDSRARYMEGTPYLLDPAETRAVEEALGHPPRFRNILTAPLVQDGAPWGTLVVATTEALDPSLLDIMGRFGNEVSLAVGRAELLAELEDANTELRRANRAKDEFVSTVSHELRTPLTSIVGFAATLRRRWTQFSPEEIDHYLEIIERQGHNQQRLVEDLLTTSRILADRLPVTPDDILLTEAISAVLDLRAVPADDVMVRCPDDVVAVVDPHHFQQTMTNLLSNAAKYGAAPYEIEARAAGDDVVILVSDHGEGVSPAFRSRLFEPFEQADASDTRVGAGVGLGLAIVKSLVEANRGTIRYVEGGPTSGACFEVRLPRGNCERQDVTAAELAPADVPSPVAGRTQRADADVRSRSGATRA